MFSWQCSARGNSGADPRFGEVRVFSCQEPEQSGTKGEADDSPGQIAEGKQSSVSDPLRSLRLPSASPHAICLGAILAVPGSGFAYGSAGEPQRLSRADPPSATSGVRPMAIVWGWQLARSVLYS